MFHVVNKVFFKELLLSIFGVLLAFMLLFFTIDALNEVKFLGQGDFHLLTYLKVLCLYQPEYIYQLLPICALIGSVLALSSMAARSELVVWRVSGVSLWRLVRIVAAVGLVLSALLWLIGDGGIARASRTATEMKKVALHKTGYFKDDGGYWSKQKLADGGFRMINVASLTADNTLIDVRLYDLSSQFTLKRMIEAQTAKPLPKSGSWQLADVRLIDVHTDAQGLLIDRTLSNPKTLDVDLAENNIDVIRNYGQETINMTMGQLQERIQTLSATGQNVRPFEVAYWQKMFYPLGVVVMVLLALPFAFMQTRKGGVGVRVVTGIMLGLSFFILTAATQYIGPLVTWSPIGLAVAPSLIFLSIAIFWIYRVTRV